MIDTLEKIRTNGDPNLWNAPTETLVLRAFGPEYQGELLRLTAAKCTIGSSPHCTLRLMSPGVRPLHCSVLRGPRGTIVRRWDEETQLNGRDFTDATLRTGDRLRCGPIEFEVVAGTRPTLGFPAGEFRKVSVTLPTLQNISTLANRPDPETTRGLDHLKTSRELLRRRMRRLLSQWRSSRWELARLQTDARRNENLGNDLHQRIAELESQIADYRHQLSQRDQYTARVDAECLSLLDQVETLTASSRNLTLDLENRTKQWDVERSDLHLRLENALQEIENAKSIRLQLVAAEGFADQSKVQCDNLTEQLTRLHQQHCETLRRLEDADQAKLDLQTSLTSAEERIAASASAERNREEESLAQTVVAEELAQWRSKAEIAETAAASSQHSMNALQERIEQLQSQFTAANQQAKDLDEVRQLLEARLNDVATNPERNEGSSQNDEFARKLSEVETTIAELRGQNDQLRDQLMDLTRDNDSTNEQLREAESSRQQLETLVNDLSSQLIGNPGHTPEKSAKELAPVSSTLDAELVHWKQRAEELQARLDQVEEQIADDRRRCELTDSVHLIPPAADEVSSANIQENLSANDISNDADNALVSGEKKRPLDEDSLFQSPLLASLLRTNSSSPPVVESAEQDSHDVEGVHTEASVEPPHELQRCLLTPSTFRDVDTLAPESSFPHDEANHFAFQSPSVDDTCEPSTFPHVNLPCGPTISVDEPVVSPLNDIHDEPSTTAFNPSSITESVHQPAATPLAQRKPANSEEESIEDYMARLLCRMRSDSPPSKNASEKPVESAAKSASSLTSAMAQGDATKEPTVEAPKKPQYVQRTLPAEFKANLSVMREIANSTARTAIETHQKRSWKESSHAKLFGAAIAGCASLATFYYSWHSHSMGDAIWQYGAALVGLGFACHWTVESLKFSRRSFLSRPGETESNERQETASPSVTPEENSDTV